VLFPRTWLSAPVSTSLVSVSLLTPACVPRRILVLCGSLVTQPGLTAYREILDSCTWTWFWIISVTIRMCLTESWLNDDIADSCVVLPGFAMVRADRDAWTSGKIKGGGLVLYVNNRWCNPGNITVKERTCRQDVELLAVGLRPYYVPR